MATIKADKFGNAYQTVKAWVNDAGFYKGYVELGGKLYAIEFGNQDSADNRGKGSFRWLRVTHKPKQNRPKSM